MSPTEKIIDKLKKIHAMAEGAKAIGNEAEATAFAEAFQRMLTQHKLNLTDIDFDNLEKDEPVGEHYIDFTKYPDFKIVKSAIQWQSILARVIADAHYCDIVRFTGTNKFYLVGRKSDAEVAEYTIIVLLRAAEAISRREYGNFYRKCIAEDGHPRRCRGYRDAFLLGFINRLKERYDLARNGDGQVVALVRIAREKKAVQDYMAAQREAGTTRSLQSRKSWAMNEAGRRRGRQVADEVDIDGKAVRGGNGNGQLPASHLPVPVKRESRHAFGIVWFNNELDANTYSEHVMKRGDTYNGGYFHGMQCGREKSFDYTDNQLGHLFAVTER